MIQSLISQANNNNIMFSFFLSYYRVTEEYDLVANPVYNISMQHTAASNPQQGMITTDTTVATTIRGDTAVPVTYEEVTNLRNTN